MLENPSFTNGPVEIDNKQAVKQITAYINKPQWTSQIKG